MQHAASPTSSANISLSQVSRFLHSSEFSLAELPTFPFKLVLFSFNFELAILHAFNRSIVFLIPMKIPLRSISFIQKFEQDNSLCSTR